MACLMLWSLLLFSACSQDYGGDADRLNDISYAYHYRNLDSTLHYARMCMSMSGIDNDSRAEAMNNIAFVNIMQMDYANADSILNLINTSTDNQVELLIADIQQMRLCQRMSRNREFYDYRERAQQRFRRIREEKEKLNERLQHRMVYAESEYAIVSSTYYYYVGLLPQSAAAINTINPRGDIQRDTAQYLSYLYNIGSGGLITKGSPEEICQSEIESLVMCYVIAKRQGYKFFTANSLQAIGSHLLESKDRQRILEYNPLLLPIIGNPDIPDSLLAGYVTEKSLVDFVEYGDIYQISGAYRSLATCCMRIGDYESAVYYLSKALLNDKLSLAPDLVASIREQMSVAYSALDDKPASDYNRNIYLDMQDKTRQDRYYESRAAQLEETSIQLNMMIVVVICAIVLMLFLLWFFNHLSKHDRRDEEINLLLQPLKHWQQVQERQHQSIDEHIEAIVEQTAMVSLNRGKYSRENMDNRAKMSLVNNVMPFIDRIIHEVNMLSSRPDESSQVRQGRHEYILQLIDKIIEYNGLLTDWIQLKKGNVSLHVESFHLSEVFDIVRKSKTSFHIKGIDLDVADTNAVVKADRVLTLFMINTLADNARKFTPTDGKVKIYAEDFPDYVEISVKDTGEGMTPDELSHVLNPTVNPSLAGGHGFGLLNCHGIIEKYKKMSQRFSMCILSAESVKGEGSRFFFRLPHGVVRTIMAFCLLASSWLPSVLVCRAANPLSMRVNPIAKASAFADSAYFSNIAGTYERTLFFADSCRIYLNEYYLSICPHGKDQMKKYDDNSIMPAELKWLRDNIDTDYEVILDMRNESAVAALALHRWKEYSYNNDVYTRLFKELSADSSLPGYCKMMRQQQQNKSVAVTILIILLLIILPAYYLLYYRHRLYYRYCVEKIKDINHILESDTTSSEKLLRIQQTTDNTSLPERLDDIVKKIVCELNADISYQQRQGEYTEELEDELHKMEYERNQLYISNSITDNCLSALKHETMYYPARIKQLVTAGADIESVGEIVKYYRDLYSILSLQTMRQTEHLYMSLEEMETYLLEIMKKANNGIYPPILDTIHKDGYVTRIYDSKAEGIPYLVMRQIIRDMSEITGKRGCGIWMDEHGHLCVKTGPPVRK